MEPREARDLFPICERFIFMNHAGVSPASARVQAAVGGVLSELARKPYPSHWAMEEADRLREPVGQLIGAGPGCIAFTRSTAHGISLLAGGLDWRPGDNVVSARGEYPANVYPWLALGDRGVETRFAEPQDGRVTPETVLELVDGRTRVVALSHVEFWNGYRVDLETIGEECARRGVLLAVDAIQSAGALRIDVERMHIDFLAAGTYKWLLGPQGMGICFIRPELAERLRPVLVGVASMAHDLEYFDYHIDFAPGARRFEESSVSMLGIAALNAAVSLLGEVGLEAIERRVLELSGRLATGLAESGYEIVGPWPRAPEESSGIVSFRRPGGPPQEPLRELTAAGIVGCVHSDFVRLSPHFYNSERDVDRVLEVLAPVDMR